MVYIIILIIILVYIFRRPVKQWLARKAADKTEDFIRQATGMPPRPGSRKARKQQRREAESQSQSRTYAYSAGNNRHRSRQYSSSHEHIIPPEYAEDVDFVETVDWSETTEIKADAEGKGTSFTIENQVSEAEWVEIKTPRKK